MSEAFKAYKRAAEAVYAAKKKRDLTAAIAFPAGSHVVYEHAGHRLQATVLELRGGDLWVRGRKSGKEYRLNASRVDEVLD